jgi:hypothetical protein
MRIVEELVGIVTAASQALEGGFVLADPKVARESASQARRAAAAAPEVVREAAALCGALPASTLQAVSESVARHWRAYEEALAGASTREQIRSIHFALMACLNRELATLREHEPKVLPGVLKRWWVEYS